MYNVHMERDLWTVPRKILINFFSLTENLFLIREFWFDSYLFQDMVSVLDSIEDPEDVADIDMYGPGEIGQEDQVAGHSFYVPVEEYAGEFGFIV